MRGIVKLTPVIKDYAWGNNYFISNLLGQQPNGPQAELWIGAHKSGSSAMGCASGECDGNCCYNRLLSEYIQEHPCFVGDPSEGSSEVEFPFLLKVLAIGEALSLQCHPNAFQAKTGFEAGNKAYQDANPKAEMLYALTPVLLMCGFREFEAIQAGFKRVVPNVWARYFSKVGSIADFFHTLYHLSQEDLAFALKELSENSSRLDSDQQEVFNIIYPKYSDPGVFAPLFLNVARLKEGEAVFLKPQVLHAYVLGNGVELMNNSDNVLRAGLTKKYMDVDELERIMLKEPYYPNPMTCIQSPEGQRFETGAGFALTVIKKTVSEVETKGPKLVLCTEGSVVVGPDCILEKGECCIAGSQAQGYKIDATNGCAFMASK